MTEINTRGVNTAATVRNFQNSSVGSTNSIDTVVNSCNAVKVIPHRIAKKEEPKIITPENALTEARNILEELAEHFEIQLGLPEGFIKSNLPEVIFVNGVDDGSEKPDAEKHGIYLPSEETLKILPRSMLKFLKKYYKNDKTFFVEQDGLADLDKCYAATFDIRKVIIQINKLNTTFDNYPMFRDHIRHEGLHFIFGFLSSIIPPDVADAALKLQAIEDIVNGEFNIPRHVDLTSPPHIPNRHMRTEIADIVKSIIDESDKSLLVKLENEIIIVGKEKVYRLSELGKKKIVNITKRHPEFSQFYSNPQDAQYDLENYIEYMVEQFLSNKRGITNREKLKPPEWFDVNQYPEVLDAGIAAMQTGYHTVIGNRLFFREQIFERGCGERGFIPYLLAPEEIACRLIDEDMELRSVQGKRYTVHSTSEERYFNKLLQALMEGRKKISNAEHDVGNTRLVNDLRVAWLKYFKNDKAIHNEVREVNTYIQSTPLANPTQNIRLKKLIDLEEAFHIQLEIEKEFLKPSDLYSFDKIRKKHLKLEGIRREIVDICRQNDVCSENVSRIENGVATQNQLVSDVESAENKIKNHMNKTGVNLLNIRATLTNTEPNRKLLDEVDEIEKEIGRRMLERAKYNEGDKINTRMLLDCSPVQIEPANISDNRFEGFNRYDHLKSGCEYGVLRFCSEYGLNPDNVIKLIFLESHKPNQWFIKYDPSSNEIVGNILIDDKTTYPCKGAKESYVALVSLLTSARISKEDRFKTVENILCDEIRNGSPIPLVFLPQNGLRAVECPLPEDIGEKVKDKFLSLCNQLKANEVSNMQKSTCKISKESTASFYTISDVDFNDFIASVSGNPEYEELRSLVGDDKKVKDILNNQFDSLLFRYQYYLGLIENVSSPLFISDKELDFLSLEELKKPSDDLDRLATESISHLMHMQDYKLLGEKSLNQPYAASENPVKTQSTKYEKSLASEVSPNEETTSELEINSLREELYKLREELRGLKKDPEKVKEQYRARKLCFTLVDLSSLSDNISLFAISFPIFKDGVYKQVADFFRRDRTDGVTTENKSELVFKFLEILEHSNDNLLKGIHSQIQDAIQALDVDERVLALDYVVEECENKVRLTKLINEKENRIKELEKSGIKQCEVRDKEAEKVWFIKQVVSSIYEGIKNSLA